MKYPSKHWPRIAVTLIPLIFALLHAADLVPLGVIIDDARLRASMRLLPFDPAWDGATNFETK